MSAAAPVPETRPRGAGEPAFAALLAFCALLALLLLQLLEPFFFLRDDNATHFLAAYTYAYDALVGAGELPLVNQHQFLGHTFLASGQTGVLHAGLYPATALWRAAGGDARGIVDLLATLHLALGGAGMLLLLRSLGVRRSLAFPLALGWALFPFGVLVARSWVFVTYVMAYLPWNTWLLLRFLERPTARRGALLALVKTLFLLTGYVQYMVIASFFELAFLALRFFLERRGGRWRREAAAIAAIFGLTALLSAPLLVPLWNAKQASAERAGRISTETALSFALGPADFARAQLLYPREGALFRFGSGAAFYLGLPVLLALGVAARRRRELGSTQLAALGAGLFALAMSTLLYFLLYLTPLFASLRWPFKNFPVAGFFLLLAAAGGAGLFAAGGPRKARLAAALLWLNVALQLTLFLVPAWRQPFGPHRFDRPVEQLRESPLMRAIGEDGRAIALIAPQDPPMAPAPIRLGFLYATLAGKYHLAGYDPLLAQLNHELAPPTSANTELLFSPAAWPSIRSSLEARSGRYLLVAADSALRPALAADPAVRLLAESEGTLVFELKSALPIVLRLEDGAPLPFRWKVGGLELDLPADFPGGHLLMNLAALPGYALRLDGEELGPPQVAEKRLVAAVPPGAHHLELRYADAGFAAGRALALGGLLLLWLALRAERRIARFMAGACPDDAAGGGPAPHPEHRLAEGVEEQPVENTR